LIQLCKYWGIWKISLCYYHTTVLNSWCNSANIKGFGRYHYVIAMLFVYVFISYFLSNHKKKKILDAIMQILRDLEDILMLLPCFFFNGFISYFISNKKKKSYFLSCFNYSWLTVCKEKTRRGIIRDGNTGQPALFRLSPLLARQKQGGGGADQLEGVGSNSHPAPPKGGLAGWRAVPSIF